MPKGIYESKKRKGLFKKGHIFSKKTKNKMSKSQRRRFKLNLVSKETREKLSEAYRGKKSRLYIDGRTKRKGYKTFIEERRRVRKREAEGSHTFGEWELLKKQYGYKCPACDKKEPKITLTEDHIIPLSKGGSDYIENIQPLCRSCNSRKMTKIIKYVQKN